jgi:formylglycine-generating enzyme
MRDMPFGHQSSQEMVWIEPCSFLQGSLPTEEGRLGDEPQHQVTLTSGFWMSTTPVTLPQWLRIMRYSPTTFFDAGNRPVTNIGRQQCQAFLRKLNLLTKGPFALLSGFLDRLSEEPKKSLFRLPTEAEWECACRAGTTGAYGRDIDTIARNRPSRCGAVTTPCVGKQEPNAWGLHDMDCLVYEWCHDLYGEYPPQDVCDPTGAPSGLEYVTRGGSPDLPSRSAARHAISRDVRDFYIGFRVAMGPVVKAPLI